MHAAMVQETVTQVHPAHPILAAALKLQLAATADAAGQRAVDNALEHLRSGAVYDFDGVALRISSYSRRNKGVIHVTDGMYCTCEGGRHPWCRHRALFRLLLAELALQSPSELRAKVVEEHPAIAAPSYDMVAGASDEEPAALRAARPKKDDAMVCAQANKLYS